MHSAKRIKIDDIDSSPSKEKRSAKSKKAVTTIELFEIFEGQKSNVQFLDLNDASIQSILDYLEFDDIVTLALACKRLYSLSSEWFFAAYPYEAEQVYRIEANAGILKFPGCSEYVALFSHINAVSLGAAMNKSIDTLMKYFEHKTLNEIRFCYWRPMRASHLKKISTILKSIKTVIFIDMKFADEPYKCILQHMPAIERLEIWTNLNIVNNDDNWLHQTYPRLKHFAWHTKTELNVAEMAVFFTTNAQIERFSLLSHDMSTINGCIDAGINITELFLKIEDNLNLTLAELTRFCGADIKKRLHLHIDDKCRDDLSKCVKMLMALSKNIDGLYFNKIAVDKPLIAAINQIGHLKCLQLRASKLANTLTELHCLEEIWLPEKKFVNDGDNALEAFESFAIHSQSLKKIHFRNNPMHEFDFHALDAARELHEGLPKITVYGDASLIGLDWLSEIETKFKTLHIKAIEIEDIDNPLMNEFMKLKAATDKR